jgi:hypothetical protein
MGKQSNLKKNQKFLLFSGVFMKQIINRSSGKNV